MKITVTFLLITFSSLTTYSQDLSDENEPNDSVKRVVRNIISLFPSKATKVNGFCFTFSHNKKRTINGLNIELPGARFTEYFIYSLSQEIYPDRFATINGLTISFNPIYKKVSGVGIFFFVPEVYEFHGLSIGPLNSIEEMHGLQLGLFNNVADGQLVQIGIINTIASNPKGLRTLPIINFRLKKKNENPSLP